MADLRGDLLASCTTVQLSVSAATDGAYCMSKMHIMISALALEESHCLNNNKKNQKKNQLA